MAFSGFYWQQLPAASEINTNESGESEPKQQKSDCKSKQLFEKGLIHSVETFSTAELMRIACADHYQHPFHINVAICSI